MGHRPNPTRCARGIRLQDAVPLLVEFLGGEQPRAPWWRYRDDPEGFARDVLGVSLLDYQREILTALVAHPRVAVPGGHATGKTWVSAVAVLWFLATRRGAQVLTTGPGYFQVEHRLWAKIRRLYAGARKPIGGELLSATPLLRMGPEWEAVGISPDDPSRFQGGHAEHLLVVMIEAQGIAEPIYLAAETMMVGPSRRWLCEGNPIESAGPFFGACRDRALWHVRHVSVLEHPNVLADIQGVRRPYADGPTLQWVEERRKAWGEKDPRYIGRVLGQFPEGSQWTIVTLGMLEGADREDPGIEEPAHMGVDVARYGGDRNVALLLEDRIVREMETWEGQDVMSTVGKIQRLAEAWKVEPSNVHVDATGLGAGVVDRLYELSFPVDYVEFGAKPLHDEPNVEYGTQFLNRRAELWWRAREWLRRKQLRIPERFSEVWTDLMAPTYRYQSEDGKLQIEPKEQVRKRLGRSPDAGDALCMALSRIGSREFIFRGA